MWRSIAIILLFSGCAEKPPVDKNKEAILSNVKNAQEINPLALSPLADEKCQKLDKNVSLQQSTVWSLINSSVLSQLQPFGAAKSSLTNGLFSNAIASTIFGLHQIETMECSNINDLPSCTRKKIDVISEAEPLRICNSNGKYARNSLESIAISNAWVLDNALAFFKASVPSTLNISKIVLYLQPKWDVLYTSNLSDGVNKKLLVHHADNGAYTKVTTNSGSNGAILLFPATALYQQNTNGVTLGMWEIPFFTAHEYGHHLYSSMAPKLDNLGSSTSLLSMQLTQGARTIRDVSEVLSEAYGDLFAGYFTAEPNAMSAIPGVCSNRNFTAPSFEYNGMAISKTLSSNELDVFFGRTADINMGIDVNGCTPLSYNDPHQIGTIIAYGANALMPDMSASQKLNIISQWVQQLDSVYLQNDYAENFLGASIISLANIISMQNVDGKLTSRQCEVFKSVFAFIKDKYTGCAL